MDVDAIVIGAGAAGLTAARSLAGHSLRVLVLEARNRIGGRAWSEEIGRAAVPAELGAEFIHGRAEETMALLRDAGSAAIELGGESWICIENGELVRADEGFSSAAGILEGARALAEDESVDSFLRRFDDEEALRETVKTARAFVEGFEAADPRIASARAIADELASGVDFTSTRPLGGYRLILERLRDECAAAGAQIVLETTARRISWQPSAVVVDATSSSGEPLTFRARTAIVTLPVGVLRHAGDESAVEFDPVLPSGKSEALASIEMGHAVRVVLHFRTAFWERIHDGRYRNCSFFRCLGQPFGAYWTQFPLRGELITAWVGGPKAIALNGSTQADLIDRALNGFGTMLGAATLARDEFAGGVMHDWGRDPFARGAYSYVAVGGGNAREALGAPLDGTLFFAGEATSTDGHGGTVNGALETGARAAREAEASLRATV
jgi:monoamine oxidase